MLDSDRYEAQAREVLRLAKRARSATEKEVYASIADGWKKLAAEAARNEARSSAREQWRPQESRSFHSRRDG